jgi:hypothetical protein
MQYYNVQAVDDLLLLALTIIEDQIIRWVVSLREKVSYFTRHTYMAAILTFYEINDITLSNQVLNLVFSVEGCFVCSSVFVMD